MAPPIPTASGAPMSKELLMFRDNENANADTQNHVDPLGHHRESALINPFQRGWGTESTKMPAMPRRPTEPPTKSGNRSTQLRKSELGIFDQKKRGLIYKPLPRPK